MGKELCWLCGFKGSDLDLHIGQCGDIIREGKNLDHWSPWVLNQLVDHRLHLEAMRRDEATRRDV